MSTPVIARIVSGLAATLLVTAGAARDTPGPGARGHLAVAAAFPTAGGGNGGGCADARRDADGHFYLVARINGVPVRLLVDTGATAVVLRRADAARAGIVPPASAFARRTSGLGGDVSLAPTRLASVEIGSIAMHDVDAAVDPGGLDVSLLGQSYLARLSAIEIRGDRLALR